MTQARRSFLKKSSIITSVALFSSHLDVLAGITKKINTFNNERMMIFQTNDLNGRIESNNDGFGGIKNIVELIKTQETSGLNVDAGNFLASGASQHEQERTIYLMNKIGYHAVTLGANELTMGQESFAELLPQMDFPLVNCNYTFSNTKLSSSVKPYIIIKNKNLKIGITGVGTSLNVPSVEFKNPYQAANNMADYLKNKLNCDFVICLSHLGFETEGYSSKGLAEESEHIDFIAGGNDNKVLRGAMVLRNKNKCDVALSQAGQNGMILGKTTFGFDAFNRKNDFHHKYLIAGLSHREQFTDAHLVLGKLSRAQKHNS
jgi:5'-nucleotidase